MSGKFSLDDYIDVAERIAVFTEKYPDGSLQTIDWDVREIGGQLFIVYRAAAFRTPGDKRPGHGTAWEPFPGTTPYTKNSELMNAETAAWGRAIVAIGLSANRKIASKQEVRARQEEQTNSRPPVDLVSAADVEELKIAATGLSPQQVKLVIASAGVAANGWAQVPKAAAADLAKALAAAERES